MRRPEAAKEQKERRVAASDLAMVLLLHPAMSSQRLVRLRKGGGGKGSPGPRVQDAMPRDDGHSESGRLPIFITLWGNRCHNICVMSKFTSIEIEKVDVFSCSRQNGSLRSKLSPWE